LHQLPRYLLLVLLALCIGGCGLLVTKLDSGPQLRQMSPFQKGPLCRVAVLPFSNGSDYPLADAIFYKVFAAQFQAAGDYLFAQEGDILKIYQQLRLLPGEAPTQEQLQLVASRLDAQLLITGTVIEMRENPGMGGSVNPVLAVDVLLRDGQSSEPLWGTYHRRQGADYRTTMHFGTIQTVTGLSRQVADEIINLWFKKGLPRCDVLPRS
jgi:polysaccharide biosynthesis protein PelC